MILIEFEGGAERKFRMEFHPLLTVVEGFGEPQRHDLAARLQGAITGSDVGFRFNVDIGGEVQPLTTQTLVPLGLSGASLENVMRAAHLPGVAVVGTPAGALAGSSSEDPAAVLATARAELQQAQARLAAAEQALEHVRNPRSPVESSEVEQLAEAHEASRAEVAELRERIDGLPLLDSPEERERRIARLESIAQAIRDRTKELRVLIERLDPPKGASGNGGQPSPADLADAWIAVGAEIAQGGERPHQRAPRWLVEQARFELVSARENVEELKANNDTYSLAKAQQALADAQEVWAEIERSEVDPIEGLRGRRAQIYSQAVAMLGHEVDTVDLVQALRKVPEEQAPPPPPNPERERLQRDLAASILDHQDVLHEIRELRSVELGGEPSDDEIDERVRLSEELVRAEKEEAEFGERLAELQVAARRVPLPNPTMVTIVTEERDEAAAEAQLASRKVEKYAVEAGATDVGAFASGDPKNVPEEQLDMSGVKPDAVELFVLSRVASLRQVGRGESVPLIIDAAFDRLPVEILLRLLNLLGSIASTVQIIYLASNEVPVEWAQRQNEMLAAVVRLERL